MISGEQLTNLFKEKGITGRCELCGSSNWGIAHELDKLAFIKTGENNTIESFSPAPVLVLTCGNCGNMRIFAKKVLGLE